MDPKVKKAVQRLGGAFFIWFGVSCAGPIIIEPILFLWLWAVKSKTLVGKVTPDLIFVSVLQLVIGVGVLVVGFYLLRQSGWKPQPIREKFSHWWVEEERPRWQGIWQKEARQTHEFTIYLPQSAAEAERQFDTYVVSDPLIVRLSRAIVYEQPNELIVLRRGQKLIVCKAGKKSATAFVGSLGHDSLGRTRVVGRIRYFTRHRVLMAYYYFGVVFFCVWMLLMLLALSTAILDAMAKAHWIQALGLGALLVTGSAVVVIVFLRMLGEWHAFEFKVAQFWRERFDAEVEMTPRRRSWMVF